MTPIDELGNEEKDKTFSVYPDDEFYIDGNGESVKNNTGLNYQRKVI